MNETFDLTERLQALSTQKLPDDVRAAHLEQIREHLESKQDERPGDRWESQRRLVLSAAALVVLIGSAALLVMASGAMPGDRLYGTKQSIERVVGTFDADYAASHRVDELETLIERRAAPADILAAQSRLASSLLPLGDDHALRLRQRQLVLGIGPPGVPVEVAIDWDRRQSFASSLVDGELVFVDRQLAADGSMVYELAIGGEWVVTERSDGWDLVRPATGDGGEAILRIVADDDGVTIVSGDGDEPTPGQQQAAPASDEPRSTFTTDRASGSTGASTTEVGGPGTGPPPTRSTTTATRPPTTSATTTTTVATTTTTTTTGGTGGTGGTGSTTTTSKPTTTTSASTTTRPTTTRPTTTTTRPTTTTSESTTTTTAPTTTTTTGDDDDD